MTEARKFPAGAIAIVGLAGRFPGASNLDEFWHNVRNGVEVLQDFSEQELESAGVPDELRNSATYVRRGTVLEDAELFDASFFGFSPREAQILDPQQRIFLECAWEALEHAGLPPGRIDASVGVYAGVGINTYLISQLLRDPELIAAVGGYQLMLSNDKDFLCTRASYKLDLRGPSMSIQSACSTSLVAVEVACRALQRGECDAALAGGVSVPFPQRTGYLYQEGMILSPDGHCRPFDAQAMGTRPSAGCGIVVLKRLNDAVADGDTIHAVIRGAAINNDGAAKAGYTAPSVEGQAEVIATALALAGTEARSIGYVEAHGTGTPLGDPIEIAALTKVFRESTNDVGFCRLGSLKANLGHLDAAAGVAGLIKAVMVLQRRELPPLVNFRSPNPQLQLESSPFVASATGAPWNPGDVPRRAGVSSFGMGGTNAHVVLEEYCPPARRSRSSGAEVLVLSARTPEALEAASSRLATHLEANPAIDMVDVAWTLQTGRRAFEHRRAVVADGVSEAINALRNPVGTRAYSGSHAQGERPVAFMFSGQGSQFAGMGSGLYRAFSIYRDAIDDCAQRLMGILGRDLRSVLFASDGDPVINETRYSQPALFVTGYALSCLWAHWGVRPAAMIGHSVGEYVAAHLAGVFSLDDALRVVAERGRLMQSMPPGRMAAVQEGDVELRSWLQRNAPDVEIAALNATGMCTIAGPTGAIDAAIDGFRAAGIEARLLHTSHAFHSAMMQPALEPFEQIVRDVKLAVPRIAYVSNVTGDWIRAEEATSVDYYVRHLRSPVMFAAGVRKLASSGAIQLLEVGPGQVLTTLANVELGRSTGKAVATMARRPDPSGERSTWLEIVGRLWIAGVPIAWNATRKAGDDVRRIALPTYPFERRRHWVGSASSSAGPAEARPSLQELQRTKDVADFSFAPTWLRGETPVQATGRGTVWIVLGANATLSRAVAEKIGARGADAVIVEDIGALAAAAASLGKNPGVRGIVSLSALPGDRAFSDATQAFALPTLIAERLGVSASSPLRMVIACASGYGVLDETASYPDAAFSLGQVLALPYEVPGLEACLADVAGSMVDETPAVIAERVAAECFAVDHEPLVAYRRGRRWLRRFEPRALPPAVLHGWPLARDAVIVITGGLGGMGLTLARAFAEQGPCRLLLTGRRALPPRGEWEAWLAQHPAQERNSYAINTIREIESAGSAVIAAAADCSDEAAMQEAIRMAADRWGRVDALVHAAGVAGSGRLSVLKTDSDLVAVSRPKIEGLRVLTRVLGQERLSLVVLTSSINAVLGAAGVADYAAANAWLDAFAESDQWPAAWPPATVLDWGAWKEAGMAANLDVPAANRAAWQRYLASAISNAEGMEIFVRAISHGARHLVITPHDLREVIARQSAALRSATGGAIAASGAESTTGNEAADRPGHTPALADLTSLDGDAQREVAAIWVDLLGVDRVQSEDDFFALGGHSLLATRLIARVESSFGLRLTLRDIFEAPTLHALADRIVEKGGIAVDREELEF
ncbi:MAG: SDR family NAD(P)-dependent oxidoreductase [Sinobacteraceae bacterium]|nr:SDR family NAD(P)-dependent oxidoreductase [Pseudomonadales bacterium]MCP5327328.1 SDR family NAD(P)-dependent oxidoreductase [Nevskiaceae bacterium]MCP5339968.1 SDR family NAD(P)-dependent oxidoreductase [Nevskiaceae bacterium]MCP5470750.1 SDR family NAD(P)-dependent oxidoreductase [Nevskiaceae bacterium]